MLKPMEMVARSDKRCDIYVISRVCRSVTFGHELIQCKASSIRAVKEAGTS